MSGIILTSGSNVYSASPTQVIVLAGTSETVATSSASVMPITKWLVTIRDLITDANAVLEITSKHDFNGNVDFSISNKLGRVINVNFDVVIFPGPTELRLLADNNSLNDIEIHVFNLI